MPVQKRKSQKIEDVDDLLEQAEMGEQSEKTQPLAGVHAIQQNIYDTVFVLKTTLDTILDSHRVLMACQDTQEKKIALLAAEIKNLFTKVEAVNEEMKDHNNKAHEDIKGELKTVNGKLDEAKREFSSGKDGLSNHMSEFEDRVIVYQLCFFFLG